ncbi:MAG: hypothetical protein Q8R78_04805 [Candidatus Omnitrophota bacterium]|nr:hypothetical protein [Candidatus Omnitrophota bacterium]
MTIIDWIRTHATGLTEVLRQLMFVGLAFELLRWNDQQQAVVFAALSGLFSLFTSKQTVPSSRIDTIVEKRVEDRMTGTGNGR